MENPTFELKLSTPLDDIRKARDERICAEYQQAKELGGMRPWRIFAQIGARYGMTASNVFFIVKQSGLYTPRG